MSVITNWVDVMAPQTVLPGTTTSERVAKYHPDWGMFGNGMQVSFPGDPDGGAVGGVVDWSAVRFDDVVIPFDGTKVIISGVFRMPFIGGTQALFSIIGVGLVTNNASNLNSNMFGAVILDGRDSPGTGTTSTAYQIRNANVGTTQLVYRAASVPGDLIADAQYRLELEIQTTAEREDFDLLARWYRHETNQLLSSGTYTRAKPLDLTSVRPMSMTYRRGWNDNIQIQVGNEAYQSNFPVKAWNGTAFVKALPKKWSGTAWVPYYPKARKGTQWAW